MLSERFADALNEQIAREFAAGHQYVGIGAHYAAQTFPQLSAFFYEQAEEEREHTMKMVAYLLDRVANVHFGAIEDRVRTSRTMSRRSGTRSSRRSGSRSRSTACSRSRARRAITRASSSCSGSSRSRPRRRPL